MASFSALLVRRILVVSAVGLSMPAMAQQPPSTRYLGCQQFTAAQLATSQLLTIPDGTMYANFFPECSAAGTDGVCLRFNPMGTADASASPPLGSLQLYLGESASLPKIQVVLAVGATGAVAPINTLNVCYSGR